MDMPWERQPDEHPKAWAAFVQYRDLGPYRSTAKAARNAGRGAQAYDLFSRTYNWVARAAAWDAECDRVHLAEILQAQKDAVKHHCEAAARVRKHALSAIEKIGDNLDADQAIKWLQTAVKIESAAIGLPSDRTVTSIDVASKDPMTEFFDTLAPSALLKLARNAVKEVEQLTEKRGPDDQHAAILPAAASAAKSKTP